MIHQYEIKIRLSVFYLYFVQLSGCRVRAGVCSALQYSNIGVIVHYIPLHLQPFYARMGFVIGCYSNQNRCVPQRQLYVVDSAQDFVVYTVKECVS